MEIPEYYITYLKTLKVRLESEGFCETDFQDISTNELIFDIIRVELLNREMRAFEAFWSVAQTEASYWPDDWFIIGGGGNGDYFCISKGGVLPGVYCFEHELLQFTKYASSLEDFYQKTMEIMRPRLDNNA